MTFKVGDFVIVIKSGNTTNDSEEFGWIGIVTKIENDNTVSVDMSRHGVYGSPIGYYSRNLRLATKLERALL